MAHQVNPVEAGICMGENDSRIRTKSVRLSESKNTEGDGTPEIILWAGPQYLFISADLRNIALEGLQIRVSATSLIFSGYLNADSQYENGGIHPVKSNLEIFSHVLDLPYVVDADRTGVQNEDGLISIILRRKEEIQQNTSPSSFLEFLRLFGGDDRESSSQMKDEITILETLDRYLEYQRGNGVTRRTGIES